MVDKFLKDIYKGILFFDFDERNKTLKYKNNILSTNIDAIIEFLGLCHRRYKNGFKDINSIYEYIKGSHFFNIDIINDKKFKEYYKNKPKKIQYNYKIYYYVDDINIIQKEYVKYFRKMDGKYCILKEDAVNIKNVNLKLFDSYYFEKAKRFFNTY
jgi:hypothetical protein